ncbi:MAG TPA: glycosyltransferase family 4 protein [Acidimicrobiales bacterium]|nr:glycosyltransferase family 4 protein [Acidimicrobiales bacterium]
MKVAYVVPRYGVEVLGGAEYGARMLAERLVGQLGWEVEVLTTCALDARTWADEYPPGDADLNGVRVRRFRSVAGRDPGFEAFSAGVLRAPESASSGDEQRWIDLQGPLNPDVVAAAVDSDADVVVFYPYLYHPTVRGVPAVGRRSVMHPAAHDEPPLRLPLFQEVFTTAGGLVFQTVGERRLAERLFPIASTPQIVMGLGVEPTDGEPAAARRGVGLDGGEPYVLCLGRVDDGKGTGMLARLFAAFKARRPGPLRLVLAGPVVDRPPAHPDVVVTGPVGESVKWGLLRGADALVSPSPFEAFSIVLVEAWTAGVPVLVNASCLATSEHVRRSGGGLSFAGYGQFEVAVERLTGDDRLCAALAGRGRDYVARNFTWPAIIDRYRAFLERAAERAAG